MKERLTVSLVGMVLLLGAFLGGITQIARSSEEEQLSHVKSSIQKMCAHCYAIEGKYPSSLEYLEKRYGLVVDSEQYIVHFYPVSSNLMPDITVLKSNGRFQ